VDLNETSSHEALLSQAVERLQGLDVVLIAHGVLGDQKAGEKAYSETEHVIRTNFLSAVSLLTCAANYFEPRRAGCIAVISSVAGDRGRGSNYVYGCSKAALTAFLGGLRNRLHRSGVRVVTIKPGLVRTPMTAHMTKTLLTSEPEVVGRGVYRAIGSRRDVVYLPGFWRPIMAVIRAIPEPVFKRLSL
jgi:short-subunit dehydrogenase